TEPGVVLIDPVADVLQDIINEGDVYVEILNMLEGEYGNVYFDATTNEFYYIDEDGNQQAIDWSEFDTVNTSFTLVNDQLVITDSSGDTVELDVEELANNSTFITTITSNQEFIDEIINMLEGEYGNVYFDAITSEFYYIDEDGDQQPIDWSDFDTVNTSFTLVDDQLVITDSSGDTVELDVEELANNSAFITTITSNQEFIVEILNVLAPDSRKVHLDAIPSEFYDIDDD